MLSRITLFVSIVLALRASANTGREPAPQRQDDHVVASLILNGDCWVFSASGNKVHVRCQTSRAPNEFTIDIGEDVGRITRLAVAAERRGDVMLTGLAVEYHATGGQEFLYRMLAGHTDQSYVIRTDSWASSGVLIRRTKAKRFDVMCVARVDGDSMLLTLQHLTRRGNGDLLETHTFINHCPLPVSPKQRMLETLTRHVECTAISK